MSRETFLARVRQAAHLGRAYRVHLREIPPGTGYVGASPDLCTAMASEVEAVGGCAQVVSNRRQAQEALGELLRRYQPRSALCWRHPVLSDLDVANVLSRHGVAVHDYDTLMLLDEDQRRATMLQADIGITSADYAIAETGSLLICSRPGQERVASLLPPIHVAIISENQIVPDLFDAFEKLSATGVDRLPSNIALITGPSKTGDIELQLTTGVHGPGKWHVVVMRNES